MSVLLLVLERYSFQKFLWITNHLKELAPSLRVILVRDYEDVIDKIEKYKADLYGVYFFQDPIADAPFVFGWSMGEMNIYLKTLEESKIKIFPDLQLMNWFSAKAYMAQLPDKFNLPFTKTLVLDPKTDTAGEIWPILEAYQAVGVTDIVIKKGYTYETMSIAKIRLPIAETALKRIVSKMNWIKNYEQEINLEHYEQGVDKIYIVQPWNEVVTHRSQEYRLFFVDGKPMDFFAHGYGRSHSCVHQGDKEHYGHLQTLAHAVLEEFIQPFVSKLPAVLRIDMSYTKDPKLQDEFSVQTSKGKIRYYVSEIEINPTFFFNLPISCGTSTKQFQKFVFDAVQREINTIK